MRAVVPLLALATLLAAAPAARAQWEIEDSGTKASLRGITNVGGGVAWASGTDGTVVRTEDGGYLWQGCAIPPGAEHLDFRGIQAFDENTAIVMSSGPGDQSRLYKTTDGCRTWKLLFTNPDKDGFWDALSINAPSQDASGKPLDHAHARGYVLGDPVDGTFPLFSTTDSGDSWSRMVPSSSGRKGQGCKADPFIAEHDEGAFAASNGSLLGLTSSHLLFVTGGSVSRIAYTDVFSLDGALCHQSAHLKTLPIAHGNASSGAFAIAASPRLPSGTNSPDKVVVVGGDYKLPNATSHNAAFGTWVGSTLQTFRESITPPHGFRSSVAYDATIKTWITVGPNGSDFSTDDGRNWHPLGLTPEDQPGSDRDWNALSLPFVVGPHGRIGRLRTNALPGQPAPANPKPIPKPSSVKSTH